MIGLIIYLIISLDRISLSNIRLVINQSNKGNIVSKKKPTSVIIPKDVKTKAKIKACQAGISFQDYLTEALRNENKKDVDYDIDK